MSRPFEPQPRERLMRRGLECEASRRIAVASDSADRS